MELAAYLPILVLLQCVGNIYEPAIVLRVESYRASKTAV